MVSETTTRRGKVFQRFEAKYFLREIEAQRLLSVMYPYVTPDPFSSWEESYIINSLYLDHPDLTLWRSSLFGEKNRFKLRVRSYDESPESPVYLEIKRRIDKIIKKERVAVKRASLPRLLAGDGYGPAALCKPSEANLRTLLLFRDYQETVGATPVCMVRYAREAYISAFDEPVRISLDRRMATRQALKYGPDCWRYDKRRYVDVDVFDVMLEIKFTDALPHWTRRLIGRLELTQRSMAKYVECVRALQRYGSCQGAWQADEFF